MKRDLVEEIEVDNALDFLFKVPERIGAATERAKKAEKMLGHIEAIQMQLCNETSAAAKQQFARASNPYKDALLEAAVASGELAAIHSEKDAREIQISVWQTMMKANAGPRP